MSRVGLQLSCHNLMHLFWFMSALGPSFGLWGRALGSGARFGLWGQDLGSGAELCGIVCGRYVHNCTRPSCAWPRPQIQVKTLLHQGVGNDFGLVSVRQSVYQRDVQIPILIVNEFRRLSIWEYTVVCFENWEQCLPLKEIEFKVKVKAVWTIVQYINLRISDYILIF